MENIQKNNSNTKIFREKMNLFGIKLKQFFKYLWEDCIKFPLYIIAHPLKGFDEFKRYKRGKMSVAIVLLLAAICTNILKFQFEGFMINDRDVKDLNSLKEIASVAGVVLIATVANWSITTLYDGKGTMKEIFMMISYSLFPMIWLGLLGIAVSNILTIEEMGLHKLIVILGYILTGYMFFFGIISIHEYGVFKCVLSILFTVVAALIILFGMLLFFDLFRRMYGFIYTIYREITLRELLW